MSYINELVLESLIEEETIFTNPNAKTQIVNPQTPWIRGNVSQPVQNQFNRNIQNAQSIAYNRLNTQPRQQPVLDAGAKYGLKRSAIDRTSFNMGPRLNMASGFNTGPIPLAV